MEIHLTRHARDRAREHGIDVAMIRRCCLDPDRVRSTALTGVDRRGLALTRDFAEGVIEVVVVQRAASLHVITVYWSLPGAAPQPRRRHPR